MSPELQQFECIMGSVIQLSLPTTLCHLLGKSPQCVHGYSLSRRTGVVLSNMFTSPSSHAVVEAVACTWTVLSW